MKSFTIYEEYFDLITLLSEKEQQVLLLEICKYMFEGKDPDKLNDRQMKIFMNLKRPLDKSKTRSEVRQNNKSKTNQNKIKLKSNENQNNNKSKTHQDVDVNGNVYVNNNLFSYIEETLGRLLSPVEYELVSNWEDNEVTRHAVKQTALQRATSLKYTQGILSSYKAKGLTTLEDIEADEKQFEQRKNNKNAIPVCLSKKVEKEEIVLTDEQKREHEAIKNGTYRP